VNWKKAKDTFNKHSVCKTHTEARLSCDDFMNQRTSVVQKLVRSSVFAHQGYVNWKKAKDTFNKHSVCKTHTEARLSCDDFMNQRTSVVQKLVEVSTDEEK
jgi:hypothetical protein